MRVVFFGTAEFGIPALEMLCAGHTVAAVVSTPPRQCGRGLKLCDSPVAAYARDAGCGPLYTPASLDDPQLIADLDALNADCFVVVAFKLLPREIFSLPPLGTLNIHASLLPAFRGPAPVQRAIEAGESTTGVTVFRIDEGIDTGEILAQVKTAIGSNETTPELLLQLSSLGTQLLGTTLHELEQGTVTPLVQRAMAGSRAPKLKKEEAFIDWNLPATTLFNKIRAFKPFPGTVTMFRGKRLGIEWAQVVTDVEPAQYTPGVLHRIENNFFDVGTGDGILRVVSVKPEGKRCMPAKDFLNGTPCKEGYSFNE